MLERPENSSLEKNPSGEGTCKHHWMILSPNGDYSTGTCKNCGEQKEFRNYYSYSQHQGDLARARESGLDRIIKQASVNDQPIVLRGRYV